jgi:hypothetical protein
MITEQKHRAREWVVLAIVILFVILLLSRSSGNVVGGSIDQAPWPVPAPLDAEHRELHAQLAAATEAGGKTGEAARGVARLLDPHFAREEEFALPPLGALSKAARGERPERLEELLVLTDRMTVELPRMLEEHKTIVGALGRLSSAAQRENKPEIVEFADELMLHAQTEEQVTYPAAILVGEYCKAKGWR